MRQRTIRTAEDVEACITENQSLIWYFVYKRKALPCSVDADDLFQRCCEYLLRYLPTYDPQRGSLVTWFGTICKSAVFKEAVGASWERFRAQNDRLIEGRGQVHLSAFENEDGNELVDVVLSTGEPDQLELADEALWFESLTERQQRMIVLLRLGYSVREIADECGGYSAQHVQDEIAGLLRQRDDTLFERELADVRQGMTMPNRRYRPPTSTSPDHCGQGHEWTEANTYWQKPKKPGGNRRRRCKRCAEESRALAKAA